MSEEIREKREKRQKTGGRKKGSKNKATLGLESLKAAVKIGPLISALQLIQSVYRNEDTPMATRIAAAHKALPYESPALASVKNETEITHRYVARLPAPVETSAAWIIQNAPEDARTVQ